jgi:hypothetical protein
VLQEEYCENWLSLPIASYAPAKLYSFYFRLAKNAMIKSLVDCKKCCLCDDFAIVTGGKSGLFVQRRGAGGCTC